MSLQEQFEFLGFKACKGYNGNLSLEKHIDNGANHTQRMVEYYKYLSWFQRYLLDYNARHDTKYATNSYTCNLVSFSNSRSKSLIVTFLDVKFEEKEKSLFDILSKNIYLFTKDCTVATNQSDSRVKDCTVVVFNNYLSKLMITLEQIWKDYPQFSVFNYKFSTFNLNKKNGESSDEQMFMVNFSVKVIGVIY